MRSKKKAVTFGLWDGDQRLELMVTVDAAQMVVVGCDKPGVHSVSVLASALWRARTLSPSAAWRPATEFPIRSFTTMPEGNDDP